MIVYIEVIPDPESDPQKEQDKTYKLFKKIYKEFPKAVWEKTGEGKGYEIFI